MRRFFYDGLDSFDPAFCSSVVAWDPDGRWEGRSEGVWEVVRRLLSIHVAFDLRDRGGR